MVDQQTPGLPDAGALKDLSPAVAITLLVVSGLAVILFYFGDALKTKLLRRPPEPPPPPDVVVPPVAAPAVEQANTMAREFIDELRQRNRELSERIDRQADEIARLRAEIERLRMDLERERWRAKP